MSTNTYDAETSKDSDFNKRNRVFVDIEIELENLSVIHMTLVMRSYHCNKEDIRNLIALPKNLHRVKMEKYIHRCKKKVLPHYDPKKSYTKLTEEEMP